ncbi:MAG: SWIM zinc finger family protein [Methanomicrobiales archaeon]|nr:SWIM zinc finger family protein [Methanomicrobiales archaeon]
MKDLWAELGRERGITEGFIGALLQSYGERGRKALKAIEESRVKRYLDFFVVVGRGDEYVVDDDFCSCDDFLYRGRECSHIIAVRIALLTGEYEEYRLWYYPSLMYR